MKTFRRVGSVIAGLAVAWIFVAGAEALVHKRYPPAPGTDMNDFAQVKKFVAALPLPALLLVLAGWLVATFAGTLTAALVARSVFSGYIVGGVLLAAGIVNSIIIPQPFWFSCASFLIYIGMTLAGSKLAGRVAQKSPPSS